MNFIDILTKINEIQKMQGVDEDQYKKTMVEQLKLAVREHVKIEQKEAAIKLIDAYFSTSPSKDYQEGWLNTEEGKKFHDEYVDYFKPEEYKKILLLTRLAHIFDSNGIPEEQALKLAICLGNNKADPVDGQGVLRVINYLVSFSEKNKQIYNPVHAACLFSLPDKPSTKFKWWKDAVCTESEKMFDTMFLQQMLPISQQLEDKITEYKKVYNPDLLKVGREPSEQLKTLIQDIRSGNNEFSGIMGVTQAMSDIEVWKIGKKFIEEEITKNKKICHKYEHNPTGVESCLLITSSSF